MNRSHPRARRALLLVAMASVAGVLAACSAPAASDTEETPSVSAPDDCNALADYDVIEAPEPSREYRIINVQAHQLTAYARSVAWGAEEQARESGVELTTLDAGGYQATPEQLAQMETAISQRPDAILIWATEPDALAPFVEEAKAAGIQAVVGVAQPPASDQLDAIINRDYVEESKATARCLLDSVGGEGDVLAVYGGAGSAYQAAIKRGVDEALAEYPDAQLVDEKIIAGFGAADTERIVENALTRNPNIRVVYANTLSMAIGAAQAIRDAGRTGEVALGGEIVESPDDASRLDSGEFTVVMGKAPVVFGRLAVIQAIRILEGEDVEPELIVPASLYISGDQLSENLDNELAEPLR